MAGSVHVRLVWWLETVLLALLLTGEAGVVLFSVQPSSCLRFGGNLALFTTASSVQAQQQQTPDSGIGHGTGDERLVEEEVGTLLRKAQLLLEGVPDGAEGGEQVARVEDVVHAMELMGKALLLSPGSPRAQLSLLNLLSGVGDTSQRLWLLETAVDQLQMLSLPSLASTLAANLASLEDDVHSPSADAMFEESLRLDPDNVAALLFHGSRLQHSNRLPQMRHLYAEHIQRRPDRLGVRLVNAAAAPAHFESSEDVLSWYTVVLQAMQDFVGELELQQQQQQEESQHHEEHVEGYENEARQGYDPAMEIINMPSYPWQWMGFSMRPLMQALSASLVTLAPSLSGVAYGLSPLSASGAAAPPAKRIRLGVVFERPTNHSPFRLLVPVLEKLDRSAFQIVVFAPESSAAAEAALSSSSGVGDGGDDRNDDGSRKRGSGEEQYGHHYPPAAAALLRLADEVVWLAPSSSFPSLSDTWAARQAVCAARVDVLLFMALGNTLTTQLLAVGRLAPVQMGFGHGHPVTSGSGSIDYFVSSDLFETQSSLAAREERRWLLENGGGSQQAPQEPPANGDGAQDYTEQLVLFDSLTVAWPSGAASAADSPSLSAAASLRDGILRVPANATLYHCLQASVKLHPAFDAVLKGILEADASARILLLKGNQANWPRWQRSLGPLLLQRLELVDYMPYKDMMVLVGACDVMLDTFPWGTGVTALEAFALGVPVVTLPSRVSVLQLVQGQVLQLGGDVLTSSLIATDLDDFVAKAVRLARKEGPARDLVRREIKARRHRLFGLDSDSADSDSIHADSVDPSFGGDRGDDRGSTPADAVVREWEGFLKRTLKCAPGGWG